jgi:hypothetical protein
MLVKPLVYASEPKAISSGVLSTLFQIGDISLYPFGRIFVESGALFDLQSFYFGCVLNSEESATSIATGCTVSITGYYENNMQISEVTHTFTPTAVNNVKMIFVDLTLLGNQFKGVRNLTIGFSGTGSAPTPLTVAIFDNVKRCIHS